MDIMSSDLLWIGERCYRLPVLHSSFTESKECIGKTELLESVSESPCLTYNEDNFEDEDETNITELIETLPNNRFKISLPIPQTFWSKIIGAKGVTKKRIESDTNTTIIIPRPMEQGDVIIRGASVRHIILAKKRIDAVIFSSRQKLVSTHFISIPMNWDEIRKNFISFKDQILESCGKDRGVDESIFQNPNKLHLTIGTLVLMDQRERELAEKWLKEVFYKSIKHLIPSYENMKIKMKGIEYMNDDPAEVDVLYAKVTSVGEDNILQKIANHIYQYFSQRKLMKSDSKEGVKLHVTLMNTLFREEEPDELNLEADSMDKNKWHKKQRRTFNATNILQNFHDFYFGQQELKSIQLSVRFSTAKDGYYKSSCTINF